MSSCSLISPAKINLFLKVVNKRPDGFHNIETIFERISLHDSIRLKSNPRGIIRIHTDHPQLPKGPKNLMYKVARMLKDELGVSQGVDIFIKKRIPIAAGLAGGSSNAATVLLGLNKIWNLKLTQNQLVDFAKRIGSDVAFFLYDTSWALGTERGDKIKKLSIKLKLWHLLIVPRFKLYAGEVYQTLASTKASLIRSDAAINQRASSGSTQSISNNNPILTKGLTNKNRNVSILIHYLKNNNREGISSLIYNDLEAPVLKLAPRLALLKKKLKSLNPLGVMISGSGPGVFALTGSAQVARRLKKEFEKQYSQVFVVSTL